MELLSQVDPFMQLFLDNVGTIVGVTGGLIHVGFAAPARAVFEAYREFCDPDGEYLPPFPPHTKCYEPPSNVLETVYGRIISGCIVTMIMGNAYYAWMAYRLMRRTGRTDVCCLPYGLNTPAAYAFVFQIVAVASRRMQDEDIAAVRHAHLEGVLLERAPRTPNQIVEEAWLVGSLANIVAGVVGTLAGVAGPWIVKVTPKASLLLALAGIGFTYLGVDQFATAFAYGHYGFLPLVAMALIFFGDVGTGPIPGSIIVILMGTAPAWIMGSTWDGNYGNQGDAVAAATSELGFYLPRPLPPSSLRLFGVVLDEYLSIIIPVSFTGAASTLLNVYAAQEAGDDYPVRETMIVDGLSTVVAGLFGSPLGTCVYVGHPAYKKRGGKFVYSLINAVAFTVLASTGLFALVTAVVPPPAIAPIILFVGLMVNKDAFAVTPARHLPAAILGLFPVVCQWVSGNFGDALNNPRFQGLRTLGQGSLLSGIVWVSIMVLAIDRKFLPAAGWSAVGMVFASIGLIHSPEVFAPFGRQWRSNTGGSGAVAFTAGYATLALLLLLVDVVRAKIPASQAFLPLPTTDPDDLRAPGEVARKMSRAARSSIQLAEPLLPVLREEVELSGTAQAQLAGASFSSAVQPADEDPTAAVEALAATSRGRAGSQDPRATSIII